jgi:hypothetical protein
MRTQDSDTNTLIAALQSDLPSAEDDARMRGRLVAAGACLGAAVAGGTVFSATVSHAAASYTAGSQAAMSQAAVQTVVANAASGANGALTNAVLSAGAGKGAAVVGMKGSGFLSGLVSVVPTGLAGAKGLVVAGAIATGVSYPVVAPKLAEVFRSQPTSEQRSFAHEQALVSTETEPKVGVKNEAAPPEPGPVRADPNRVDSTVKRAPSTPVAEDIDVAVPQATARTVLGSQVQAKTVDNLARRKPPPDSGPARVVNRGTIPSSQLTNDVGPLRDPTPEGLLSQETRLIERALRAQRSGDEASARNWLSVHQQLFPDGKLVLERTRMWAQLEP